MTFTNDEMNLLLAILSTPIAKELLDTVAGTLNAYDSEEMRHNFDNIIKKLEEI